MYGLLGGFRRLMQGLAGKATPRVLLCIPRGGMNDALCQIERCWDYAERHGRSLLIDSRRSGLLADFDTFFTLRPPTMEVVPRVGAERYAMLQRLDGRPALPSGVGTHRAVYSDSRGNFVDPGTDQLLTFDFGSDHPEPLLLHEQCGGGDLSYRLLDRVTLAPAVRSEVARALAGLPADYAAVHVRNTDYRTDYEPLFAAIRTQLAGRDVLVCSDDAGAIARARQVFDRSHVLTVTHTPDIPGQPLHQHRTYRSDGDKVRATIAAITDLMALGGANDLHFADVTRGYPSGFSRLARHLNDNKPVIRSLLHG